MGANIVEYHAKRLYALFWGAISLGFAWFAFGFMMSDDFQAGTITARRLRILNDMPFEWRVGVVALVVALFAMAALSFFRQVIWTRLVSVGDEGIEVVTPWRVARARWSDFKGIRFLSRGGVATLSFDPPTDGSRHARRLSLPARILGAGNKAMLLDIQQRLAGAMLRPQPLVDRLAPARAAAPHRTVADEQRKSFGRRSA